MRLVEEGKNLLLTQIKDFDIKQTLECGQCFNFIELADKDYAILAQERDLRIKQEGHDLVFFDTDKKTMEEVWIPYFDLDRDYEAIKKDLLNMDPKLEVSIKALYGMRILRQDFFETLISFILSQNKQIPQIKACVRNISRLRGKEVEHGYLFPTYDEMKDISEEELKECKTGFRAGYVLSALDSYGKGLLDEDQLKAMDSLSCNQVLKQVKGIGDKVANCISLFSLDHRDAFPVDVWIKRIMEEVYFDGQETKNALIEAYGKKTYGQLGGYAQQYIFYYGRDLNKKKN